MPHKRFLLFLINPISGHGKRDELPKKINDFCLKNQLDYLMLETPKNGDFTQIITTLKEKNTTEIIIAGGDGTVNGCISNLRHLKLPFGILPFGSGNALSRTVKISMNTNKALALLVQPKKIEVDAFSVNGKEAFMLFGIGFDAQVAYDFAHAKKRGLKTYIQKSLVNFFSLKAYPVELIRDGKSVFLDIFMLNIANTNQFGNEFKVAPLASVNDGKLDLVILPKTTIANSLWQMAQQLLFPKLQTELHQKKGHQYLQINNLVLKNPQKAPIQFDGEVIETSEEIHFKVIPKAFQLIVK